MLRRTRFYMLYFMYRPCIWELESCTSFWADDSALASLFFLIPIELSDSTFLGINIIA